MHFVEHNVGAVITFHACEEYVDYFSWYQELNLFVLTHQVFQCTIWNNIGKIIFAVLG